jgi:hypothetical protein
VNKTNSISSIHGTLADLLGTYRGQTIKHLVIDLKVGSQMALVLAMKYNSSTIDIDNRIVIIIINY